MKLVSVVTEGERHLGVVVEMKCAMKPGEVKKNEEQRKGMIERARLGVGWAAWTWVLRREVGNERSGLVGLQIKPIDYRPHSCVPMTGNTRCCSGR